MGMDVYGREPLNESGLYFRACVWEWRPLHELMHTLCADLVDQELLSAMQWNEGAGPDNAAVCVRMAERFRRWLLGFQAETYVLTQTDVSNTPEAAVAVALTNAGWLVPGESHYSVDCVKLVEWIRFLEACQGFEVW